jgi:hypothetical protein
VITRRAEKRPLPIPAALAFLALLGSFAGEGLSPKLWAGTFQTADGAALRARGADPSVAAANLDPSFIAATIAPLRPCLPVAAGAPPEATSAAFVPLQACAAAERHAVLVDALILKKYLHFRESLSSP